MWVGVEFRKLFCTWRLAGVSPFNSVLPHIEHFYGNCSLFLLTQEWCPYTLVLPYIASLVAKKKANKLYYYVVESARVDGKPRIVHQTYLGTAESVARLVHDRTAPVLLAATTVDFGLPGALWLAAEKSGVFALLESLWPKPRSGPSPAH